MDPAFSKNRKVLGEKRVSKFESFHSTYLGSILFQKKLVYFYEQRN